MQQESSFNNPGHMFQGMTFSGREASQPAIRFLFTLPGRHTKWLRCRRRPEDLPGDGRRGSAIAKAGGASSLTGDVISAVPVPLLPMTCTAVEASPGLTSAVMVKQATHYHYSMSSNCPGIMQPTNKEQAA